MVCDHVRRARNKGVTRKTIVATHTGQDLTLTWKGSQISGRRLGVRSVDGKEVKILVSAIILQEEEGLGVLRPSELTNASVLVV